MLFRETTKSSDEKEEEEQTLSGWLTNFGQKNEIRGKDERMPLVVNVKNREENLGPSVVLVIRFSIKLVDERCT